MLASQWSWTPKFLKRTSNGTSPARETAPVNGSGNTERCTRTTRTLLAAVRTGEYSCGQTVWESVFREKSTPPLISSASVCPAQYTLTMYFQSSQRNKSNCKGRSGRDRRVLAKKKQTNPEFHFVSYLLSSHTSRWKLHVQCSVQLFFLASLQPH